jgi:hypothetical protein
VISHAGERNIKEHTAEIAHSQARHLTGGGNRTWCYVAPPYNVIVGEADQYGKRITPARYFRVIIEILRTESM